MISNILRSIMEQTLTLFPAVRAPSAGGWKELIEEICNVPEKPEGYVPRIESPEDQLVILVSGGLDSTVAWEMALANGRKPIGLYIDMGQAYAGVEMNALQKLGIPFHRVTVPAPAGVNSRSWEHIQPGRNFYYASLASEFVGGPCTIWISSVEGEMPMRGGDKSWRAIQLMQRIFDMFSPYPVEMRFPVSKLTKTQEVAWWGENVGDIERLQHVVSCFDGESTACGKCQSCLRNWIAFYNNGLERSFEIHPMDPADGAVEAVAKYRTLMEKARTEGDYSHYSKPRVDETLAAFEKWGRAHQ